MDTADLVDIQVSLDSVELMAQLEHHDSLVFLDILVQQAPLDLPVHPDSLDTLAFPDTRDFPERMVLVVFLDIPVYLDLVGIREFERLAFQDIVDIADQHDDERLKYI